MYATKAFDLLKFGKLFTVLLERSLPAPVVHILYELYISQCIYVRWSNALCKPFSAQNGVRQGGVVSSQMFNLYVDRLLCKFKGCLSYADNIMLVTLG